ncbi:MAG: ABC transporter ATP-binding protein [Chloroflexi bacterium]|nr:ABC transporter ATP-binding protein [Chloroflexota bacterium]
MAGQAGVRLRGVWKRYLLGQQRSLRRLASDLLRRQGGRETLWALQDVSLEVRPGQSLGIIGHNGAGKTTLLKLLAGITLSTRGEVDVRGRVASLINLGAGFHRELTGRENIYLNGVLLGLSRREVRARFDRIVEFAELADFIDTPVKRYSAGMYARLGFAVAVHVDPDVLLVDEVLSVGDLSFQDRSLRRMLAFREQGCAVLFVSHNLSAVELMCDRVIWLDHGRIVAEGPAQEVVRAYLDAFDRDQIAQGAPLDGTGGAFLAVEQVSLHCPSGEACEVYDYGDDLVVRLRCRALREVANPSFIVTIRGDYGPLFAGNMLIDGLGPQRLAPGVHTLECRFRGLPLLPGLYRVEVKVKQNVRTNYFEPRVMASFKLQTDLRAYGSVSPVGVSKSRGGFVFVPYEWTLGGPAGETSLGGATAPLAKPHLRGW